MAKQTKKKDGGNGILTAEQLKGLKNEPKILSGGSKYINPKRILKDPKKDK